MKYYDMNTYSHLKKWKNAFDKKYEMENNIAYYKLVITQRRWSHAVI